MREPTRRRRLRGAFAATLAAGILLASPSVLAQTEDDSAWEGSAFTAPSGSRQTAPQFPIGGIFERSGTMIITDVTADIERSGPDLPDDCLPEEPHVAGEPGGTDYDFAVVDAAGDDLTWPCNGRFVLSATATAQGLTAEDRHTLTRSVTVSVAPDPVAAVDATTDGESVELTWEPIDDPAADALGYRVERAGPKGDDGSYGTFAPVGDDHGVDATSADDVPGEGGEYRYRVRALRNGADGPVLSPTTGTGIASITVEGPPPTTESTTTTTTTTDGDAPGAARDTGDDGARAVPRPSSRPDRPMPTAPTTIDSGFENELDYGDRPLVDDEEPGELAAEGEGQSVIRTEGDGAGLVAPAAGALVLLGWAGHIVYLNRLAKQF